MTERPCPTGFIAFKRDCGHKQAIPIKCKSPLCPNCERARAQRVQRRWIATLKTLPELKFMTLTIVSGKNLAERLQVLDTAFRSLLDTRLGRNNRHKIQRIVFAKIESLRTSQAITEDTAQAWQSSTVRWLKMVEKAEAKRGKSFKLRKLLKGLSSLEITDNSETNEWHAHRHLILSMPYMPQIVLSELWNLATNGQGQIVDIRAITNVETGILEAVKYVTKGWEIREERADELLTALKGKKRTWVIGRIKPQEDEPKPCPDCNEIECKCHKVIVVTEVNKLDDGTGYYTEPINEPPQRLVIYKDDKSRLTWRSEPIEPDVLSLYRQKYQEKAAHANATGPPQHKNPKSRGGLAITLPKMDTQSNKPKPAEATTLFLLG